jgi:lipopolysaccharide export system protein LptA
MTGAMMALILMTAGFALTAQAAAEKPAQPQEGVLSGFATNPNQPVEIEADRLEVEDQSQIATFIGNVVAVQGDTRLRSDRLKASYAAGDDGKRTQIKQILATGRVHVLSKDDQSADGDWASYDVVSRQIVMGDQVVLRQGQNVIRGTKLYIDLNTGRARVTGSATATVPVEGGKSDENGRVRALFQPSSPPKE